MPDILRYRKKPVEISALEYDGTNADQIVSWAAAYVSYGELYIRTLEGDHLVTVGDFVIRGVKNEFYPCKPDIFAMSYDATSTVTQ